ncbi:UNVERIFIED_CONTAM: hypothetical protein K2H54_024227 [Gekko kuhli]
MYAPPPRPREQGKPSLCCVLGLLFFVFVLKEESSKDCIFEVLTLGLSMGSLIEVQSKTVRSYRPRGPDASSLQGVPWDTAQMKTGGRLHPFLCFVFAMLPQRFFKKWDLAEVCLRSLLLS